MKIIHVILVIVYLYIATLYVSCDEDFAVEPREAGSEQNKSENSVNANYENVELPDGALMLFENENIDESVMMSYYARSNKNKNKTKKKQGNKQGNNTTSSSSTSDENRCKCDKGVCKCCTGIVLMDMFNQKACMKITYYPGDFAFDVAMSLNDRVLYENTMSGKNPKPMCMGPPRFPNVRVCAQLYNVFFPGRNFHFCLKMNGRFGPYELFNVSFDCLRMGANGLAHMKPEDNGGITIQNPQGGVDAVIDSGDDGIEEYDETNVRSLVDLFDYR